MLNLVREGEEDYIEAIRYRRRLKIFENFLFFMHQSIQAVPMPPPPGISFFGGFGWQGGGG